MSPSVQSNNALRDKLDDDTLDLSLSQMNEVTEDVVRDIVSGMLFGICSDSMDLHSFLPVTVTAAQGDQPGFVQQSAPLPAGKFARVHAQLNMNHPKKTSNAYFTGLFLRADAPDEAGPVQEPAAGPARVLREPAEPAAAGPVQQRAGAPAGDLRAADEPQVPGPGEQPAVGGHPEGGGTVRHVEQLPAGGDGGNGERRSARVSYYQLNIGTQAVCFRVILNREYYLTQ